LLRLLFERGDRIQAYMENAPHHSLYTCWSIQNELIHLLGSKIHEKVGIFSGLADGMRDVGNME